MDAEYFPYTGATKSATTNYIISTNVTVGEIDAASGKVLVTKEYLEAATGHTQSLSGLTDTTITSTPIDGEVLTWNDTAGTWSAYTGGDMVLNAVQVVTANKKFKNNTLSVLNLAESFEVFLNAGDITANRTFTFPDSSGTLSITGTTSLSGLTDTSISGVTDAQGLTWNAVANTWSATTVVLPSGLELLDEQGGGQAGWRLIGRDPTHYGTLGWQAVDFTESDTVSSVIGATGDSAFSHGYENQIGGYASTAFGYWNITTSDNNFIQGESNSSSGHGGITMGYSNVNSAFIEGITMGTNNDNSSSSSLTAGLSLNNDGNWGSAMFGAANELFTGSGATRASTDRIFVIGNGTFSSTNPWPATVRSNAFHILRAGELIAPSLTTSMIDAEATGRVLVTREYVDKSVGDDTTTAYTATTTDANNIRTLNNGGSVAFDIPTNATTPFAIGTEIVLINKGVGVVTIGGAGVTINQSIGLTMAQYDVRTIRKIGTDLWSIGY